MSTTPPAVPTARPRIASRPLVLFFLAMFGAAVSFYLLLSVVPLYATTVGSGGVGAGLTTAALMYAMVAAELAMPRLLARFGYPVMLGVALLLLGVPAVALAYSRDMAVIVLACMVRGLGFGVAVVVGSALVAALVPAQRRGEGLGLYGIVVGVPSVVALPLGVWLVGRVGYPPVFLAGAATVLAGIVVVPGLARGAARPERTAPGDACGDGPIGVLAGLRTAALVRPSVVFSATAMAAGVVVTFLPLAVSRGSGALAAVALLVQAAAATLTRWYAGRYSDRHGSAGLLVPSVIAAAAGTLALGWVGDPVAVVVGMAIFGAGFGVAQNASISLMFDRVSATGYGTVSAVWNLAYDAGLGLGAAAFGVVAANTGYPTAFVLTGALVLAALGPAWVDRACGRPPARTTT